MRKGIVMKLNKNKATLMTEDCSFCEVSSFKGMYEGMEICFSNDDILKRKNTFISNKYTQAACFVLIVFSSYLFLSFYQENIATYAYVGIDINPSIEIALNKKGVIIHTRGLDEEGKKLLEQINIEKKDSVDGVKEIVKKTIDMGYLDQEKSNEINIYTVMEKENNNKGDEIVQSIKKAINEEVVSHKIDGDIKTLVSDKKIKAKADKMGMPLTKYIEKDSKAKNAHQNKNEEKSIEVTKNKVDSEEKDEHEDKNDKKNIKDEQDKKNNAENKDKKSKNDKDDKKNMDIKDKDKNDEKKDEYEKDKKNKEKQDEHNKNTDKGHNNKRK